MREPAAKPCGDRLVRLADVPLEERLSAFRQIVRSCKTPDEVLRLWLLVLEPEDKGGRVAA